MRIHTVSDSFTRPANTTQYAAADLVANHTTAGSVVPLSFNVGSGGAFLTRIRIEKSDSDIVAADFSISLFTSSPTPANGDNGAFSTDVSDKIARIDMGAMTAGSDDDFVIINSGDAGLANALVLDESVGTIYALLEANDTYTPASAEVFTVYLTVIVL
jgi:hypothetical protein